MIAKLTVKPGQTWADCDSRECGRRIVITRVDETYAYYSGGSRGGERRILLRRMYPHSTGFRLTVDVEAGDDE